MATLQPTASETKLEVWTAVVLALISLVTAWAAFQSSLWNGVAIEEFARADAQRTAGATSFETGAGTYQEDRALFLEYYRASRGNASDLQLAAYIKHLAAGDRHPIFLGTLLWMTSLDVRNPT